MGKPEASTLVFGPFRSDEAVLVEPAFEGRDGFYIARAAARHPSFPGSSATKPGMMLGAGAGSSSSAASARAFGELVERVSAFSSARDYPPVKGSIESMRRRPGRIAITPAELGDHFLPSPDGRLEPVADAEEISWCEGLELSSGRPAAVPALASYLQWAPPAGERLFMKPGATGLAAHTDGETAVLHAIREVLERDAAMLSWRVPGWPVTRFDHRHGYEVVGGLGLEPRFFEIGAPGLPSVVLCLLAGRAGERLTCGSACGDPREAADRAIREALMLQWTMKSLSADGAPEIPTTSLDVVRRAHSRGSRIIGWYEDQARRTGVSRERAPLDDARLLAARIEDVVGGPVVTVDMSSKMARDSGWKVVRAVLPAAMPRESDHRLARFDGRRLSGALKRAGAGDVNREPHPFG